MTKRIKSTILSLILLVSISLVTSFDFIENQYFVELDKTNPNAATEFINSFPTEFEVHQVICHEFLQAVSVKVNKEYAVSSLYEHPSLRSISPIQIVRRTEFSTLSRDISPMQVGLLSPHHISQVDKVHQELKLKGEDILIGVIDSGIDYNHPALGGGFGPGFKVSVGYDLVGDNWNPLDPSSKLAPDDDPLDNCGKDSKGTGGHGTHVAGIIAGYDEKQNFTGVAPAAKLGVWRVFGCFEATRNDIVIAAMLKAFDAGANIINISVGFYIPWGAPRNVFTEVISQITAKGVSVVVAAGNEGLEGAFTTMVPGNAESALQVTSVDNEHILLDGFFTTPRVKDSIGFIYFPSLVTSKIPDGYLVLSSNGMGNSDSEDACRSEYVSTNVFSKIALVKRGGCDVEIKVNTIASKGAIGIIMFDNVDSSPTKFSALKNATIPVYTISLEYGLILSNQIINSKRGMIYVTFSKNKEPILVKSKYAGKASDFSSIGPTAELSFKPNIAAVGQLIYSTLPAYQGNWGILQGTSMACPYMAGSIALYLQYRGKNETSRKEVHEKFQNFALIASLNDKTGTYLESPIIQGAGLIQVYDTILATSHVSPSQISFNDTFTTSYRTQTLTVTNEGLEIICYQLFNNVSVSLSPYNKSSMQYDNTGSALKSFNYANIEFSLSEITILPGQSKSVQVTVYPPNTDPLDHVMYGRFIQFTSIHPNSKDMHVPYFGVVGNQRDLPVLDKTHFAVINERAKIVYDITKPIIFDVKSSKFISIYYKLFVPTLILKAELILIRGAAETVLGYICPPATYLQRDFNDNILSKSPLTWDGRYISNIPFDILVYPIGMPLQAPPNAYTTAKPGNYNIKISALKQFGDIKNDLDWDSFVIGPIIIK